MIPSGKEYSSLLYLRGVAENYVHWPATARKLHSRCCYCYLKTMPYIPFTGQTPFRALCSVFTYLPGGPTFKAPGGPTSRHQVDLLSRPRHPVDLLCQVDLLSRHQLGLLYRHQVDLFSGHQVDLLSRHQVDLLFQAPGGPTFQAPGEPSFLAPGGPTFQ